MKPTNAPKMKVLLVEDNPDDARLLQHTLEGVASALFELTHVQRLDEAMKQVKRTGFDVVLLDLTLPDSCGVETVEKFNKHAPTVPIVVLTGLADENVGLESVRKGAQDYLIKGQVDGNLLSRVMRYSRERKWGEQQLRQALIELTQSRQELLQAITELNKSHSQLKIMQLELIEAAKMESVGRLAAGVAREVKNPLATVILGMDYLRTHLGNGDRRMEQVLKNMADSVARSVEIIDQLQEFSQPSDLEVKVGDLGAVIERSLTLIKHELTGHRIDVEQQLEHDLPSLWIDANKMEQALVSVFVNAIEAMPNGGVLRIMTRSNQLAAAEVPPAPPAGSGVRFQPGDRVIITEVEDSGTGIPEDKLDKVFDPFFTTKPTGKGTGLGLTVAKKIAEMHGGRIEVANRDEGGVRVTLMFHA